MLTVNLRRGGILFLFLYFAFFNAKSYDFVFSQISIEQRLPGANVQYFFQDSKGLMWFAVESEGLCKYDGKNFKVYTHSETDSNTILNNFPMVITEDSTGHLWIGTVEGLNEFDRDNGIWKKYLYNPENKNSIPDNYINNLYIDKNNNIWIATNKGLSKYNKAQNTFSNLLTAKDSDPEKEPQRVMCFYEDSLGNIWTGTYGKGLYLINNFISEKKLSVQKNWSSSNNIKTNTILSISEYNNRTLLLGTSDGIYLFDLITEQKSKYYLYNYLSLNPSYVDNTYKDSDGLIWIGYAANGILLINPENNEQTYFNAENPTPKGIKSNSIRRICEDQSGLIWVATKFQGLFIYDKKQEMFNKHPYNTLLNKSLKNKYILSLMEDSDHNLWVGTKNDGLFKYSFDKNYLAGFSKYEIANNKIRVLKEDRLGNIWVGTEEGLYKYNNANKHFLSYNNDYIRCIESDKNGNLWIGTQSSGLQYYNINKDKLEPLNFKNEPDDFKLNTISVVNIKLTSDSLLWICTFEKGLYKYNLNNEKLILYINDINDTTGLASNMVREVYEDKTGKIWIGTKSNGLFTYNFEKGNFTHIHQKNNLIPTTIYSILEDQQGNFWFGSHEGLYKYNNRTNITSLFKNIDGLKNSVFEVQAKCKTHNDLLIFGGSEGLNVFNPLQVHKTSFNAPLIITSVKVYDKLIAEDVTEYKELEISYKEKYISIGYALIDYSNPFEINYKYKLEGFDMNWIDAGNKNFATYTSLSPGDYYFKVLAINSDNISMTEPTEIKIKIKAPFWRNPFFTASCIILITLLIVIFYRERLRFIRRNEKRLKELVDIKTQDLIKLNEELIISKDKAEESDRLKSAFLANISHEIRTPINGINGFSKLLEKPELSGEKQKLYLDVIRKSSDRMLRIINDLIDISIIEAGEIKVKKEPTSVNSIMNELFTFYKYSTQKSDVKIILKNELNMEDSIINADKGRVSQILSNLIDNALKVTISGQIIFGYTKKPNVFEFYVKDTGPGISPDMLKIIFERFRQIEDTKGKFLEGTGLGLPISKALVESHGGKIWVESIPGKGSIFYFTIPIDNCTNFDVVSRNKGEDINLISKLEGNKILIAEDDDVNFMFLQEITESYNMKVYRAENGAEAIDLINNNPDISIILMDMKMPGINGIDATKIIKQKYKHIHIIMQTAFAQADDKKKALKNGCDDYITKPFKTEELIEMICKYF